MTFLESGEPGVDWLRPAFESIQETPFRFHQPSQLSCRTNRGDAAGSLFRINHWIETPPTPRPSNAATVNAYDFLLGRAEQMRARALPPPEHHRGRLFSHGNLLGSSSTSTVSTCPKVGKAREFPA